MNYNVDERYNAVVITLKGNVMGGPDGADLHNTLHELREKGKHNVVVDLSKTKFMNSSGLGIQRPFWISLPTASSRFW